MTAGNLVSYSAQVAILVLACAALPHVLRVRSPRVQYLFWRSLLALGLLLPAIEPWRHKEIAFARTSAAAATPPISSVATPAVSGASFAPHAETIVAVVLLCGIAARLMWLGAGLIALRRLRGRATQATAAFDDLQRAIGTDAIVRWSADVRHPVTFGIARPVVLLPDALADVDPAARRAVVAHELHHVKRRDWAWVVGEEIIRSIFWFHPAIWWLISRVQLARETVVDELSIRTTNARRAYLDALLAFADDGRLVSTPAFSARRHLFHRVMLLSKEGNMSSSKIALASTVLVAALGVGSWGAVSAFPLASTTVAPDVAPQLAAVRHAAVQQSPQTPATSTTPGQLPALPPPPASQANDLPESFQKTIERLHPVRIGDSVVAPIKIKDVRPAYPEDAMAARIQGQIELEAIVDPEGRIADARVVTGVPELNDAALNAVKEWVFKPTLLNGEPTAVIFTCTITFTLR